MFPELLLKLQFADELSVTAIISERHRPQIIKECLTKEWLKSMLERQMIKFVKDVMELLEAALEGT